MTELVRWAIPLAAALFASTLAAVTGFGGAAVLLPILATLIAAGRFFLIRG